MCSYVYGLWFVLYDTWFVLTLSLPIMYGFLIMIYSLSNHVLGIQTHYNCSIILQKDICDELMILLNVKY